MENANDRKNTEEKSGRSLKIGSAIGNRNKRSGMRD